MSPIMLGIAGGLGFGTLSVLLMLPLKFPDKRQALTAAFCSRFAIGFLIPLVSLPVPPVARGVLVALLVSLPDAIITRAYLPVLGIGCLGGAVLGWLAGAFGG